PHVRAPRDRLALRRRLARRRGADEGDDREHDRHGGSQHASDEDLLIGNAAGMMRSTLAPSQRQPGTWLQYCSVALRAFAQISASSTRVRRPPCTSTLPSTITVSTSRPDAPST